MNEQTKNNMVPQLRFPEFRNEAEWNIEPFGNLYSFKVTNSFSRDNLNYYNGSVKNIHYGDIHTKFSTLFDIRDENVPYVNSSLSVEKIKLECYCVEGDMIFADASEDLEDVGKSIEIVNLNNEKLLSGMHTLLARQKKPKLIVGFGGHLFMSNGIRTQIRKQAQGAKVLGISVARLSKIEIYYPQNKDEQQKIADCLTSIDDLITAQSQKLDALKAHKKGMLQQLFPAESEPLPRMRFPEFRDAGEWLETELGKHIKINSGKGFQASEYTEEGVRLLQIENVGYGKIKWNENSIHLPESYTLEYPELILKKGDIVLALNRPVTNNELKIARLQKCDEPSILYQRVGRLELISESLNNEFIFQLCQYFVKDFVAKQSIGSDQPFISIKELYELKISIPSPLEQQKIADCLSSIDELITTQSQKLDSIKAHKKGLMQQLFPSINNIFK